MLSINKILFTKLKTIHTPPPIKKSFLVIFKQIKKILTWHIKHNFIYKENHTDYIENSISYQIRVSFVNIC